MFQDISCGTFPALDVWTRFAQRCVRREYFFVRRTRVYAHVSHGFLACPGAFPDGSERFCECFREEDSVSGSVFGVDRGLFFWTGVDWTDGRVSVDRGCVL